MSDTWYSRAEAADSLMQGDLILDCPLVVWSPGPGHGDYSSDSLKEQVEAVKADLIVMTQACDLAQENVDRVVLCTSNPIELFYEAWREERTQEGKGVGRDEFRKLADQIRKGFKWNLHLLQEAHVDGIATPQRVVDFSDVHTIPREFLERLLESRAEPRLRLEPPYREHLSQSFARYFMRVGLPTDIDDVWLPPPAKK
jgi:hypothetical protein